MVQKFKNFCLVFKENCLKQKKCNLYSSWYNYCFIVYESDTWSQDLSSDFTLKDCLYGGVKLAKNAYLDKCVYNDYGIGFDSRSEFSLTDASAGKNVTIFGINMSSSVHIDNKKNIS